MDSNWVLTLLGRLTAARALLLDQITALRMAELDAANMPADLDTIKDYLDTEIAAILAAVVTEVAEILAYVDCLPAALGDLVTKDLADILSDSVAFTGANIAELDAANIPADIDGLKTSRGRQLFSMDFWSDLTEEVAVTGAQSTIALSPVTIADLPGGATIVRAIAMFKFRMVENTYAGVNKLDAAAALPIQVDDGAATGYVTAIDFVDDAFTLAASTREGGDVIIGDNDIAARVDGNDTYPVRWLNAKADQGNLQFNDVQCGLRIWYSV